MTFILALLVALVVARHESGSPPMLLRAAAGLALPVGLALLLWSHLKFVETIPFVGGTLSEVIAAERLPTCDCDDLEDAICLQRNINPLAIEKCWGRWPVKRNRLLWSSAYLLSALGALSLAALPWCRSSDPALNRPTSRLTAPAHDLPRNRPYLFLSYSSKDGDLVKRLVQDLEARGISVWLAELVLIPGDSLPREIESGIANSRWFGIALSPDAVASPWVRMELEQGLIREIEDQDFAVLPILLRPCEIPLSLRTKLYANFTESYDTGLEALLHSLMPKANHMTRN